MLASGAREVPRTFKVQSPHMQGNDVREWQKSIIDEFAKMHIDCPIRVDGDYGIATRSFTAALCRSLGMNVGKVMDHGVSPELRIRVRNRRLTVWERARMFNPNRVDYRRKLRRRWSKLSVSKPVAHIIADSWGYHPGIHDGIDVICNREAPCFAMVRSKVIDVRADGWWGQSPSGDVSKGDGIVQLEVLEDVGPFRKGYHIGYGHCEHARVREGEIVQAGQVIAEAGLAVAWHIHLMYNDGSTNRGIGNRDPRNILEYAKRHG